MHRLKPGFNTYNKVRGPVNLISTFTIRLQVRVQANNQQDLKNFKKDLEDAIVRLAVQRPRQKRHNVSVAEAAADRFSGVDPKFL